MIDYQKAIDFHREAADRGDAAAQCYLGCCYKEGFGVSEDWLEAALWYQKAAEQGHAIAQLMLGFPLTDGREAAEWYRRASEQGNVEAQYRLGEKYGEEQNCIVGSLEGRDFVPRNDAEAVKWYRKAAEQGHRDAQYALGRCYAGGKGVTQDLPQAYLWIRLAAEQGRTENGWRPASLASLMFKSELEEAQRLYREFKDKHSKKQ